MLNDIDNKISHYLKLNGIKVDRSGKIALENQAVLDLISGGAGEPSSSGDRALWNGACSNAHCLLS